MHPKTISAAILLSLAPTGLAQVPPTLERTARQAPAQAPARASLPAPTASLDARAPARDRVLYDEPGDGSVWARGTDYKAGFEADGVTFVPFQGSDAPRSWPLRFAPVEVTAGGVPLALARDAEPRREGDRVSFERGAVTELYELAPGGMEQMFVFPEPTPEGRLVLALGVATDLACGPDGEGLKFDGERGGVRYGAATVLDAAGRTASAPLEWTGAGIAIEVSAEFLADASWPVTVDPLVATFLIDDYFEGLLWPDAAYDLSTDSYLVVYEEVFSSTDVDVYYRQIDAGTTTLIDEGYINATTEKWQRPRVANNNFADRFLVVAQEEQTGTSRTVVSRTIDAAGGVLGPVQGIDGTEFVDHIHPDVGGDFFDGGSFWCVVWTEDDTLGRIDVKYRMVDATGLPIGTADLLTNDTVSDERPAISSSAGEYNGNSSYWTIVWQRGSAGSRRIHGAQVFWDGSLYLPPFPISGAGDATEASVSSLLDGTGDRPYMVAYQKQGSSSMLDIGATVMVANTVVLDADLTRLEGAPTDVYQALPSVDSDGQRFVLAYVEHVAGTSFDDEIYMSTYAVAGANLCPSESRVRVTTDPLQDSLVEVTTDYSGGGARRRALAVWSRGTSEFDANVLGALYDAALPDCLGTPFCSYTVPTSSGQGALLRATGSHLAGGNPLTLHATRLPAFQFGYFIASLSTGGPFIPPGSQGLVCLGGNIARFNRPGEIGFSGAAGAFDLSVDTLDVPLTPPVAILPGQTWYFQGWVRDMNPTSTSNFTNGLGIRFD